MAKLIYFIVFDNNKKVFDLCPITKNCRSRSGERQFFFILYLIYINGIARLQILIDDEVRNAILNIRLNCSFQWTGAKLYVVTLLCHKLLGGIAKVYLVS